MQEKMWFGSKPSNCDMCGCVLCDKFVDGKVASVGSWGILCPECHVQHGVGLGMGMGQEYTLKDVGWVKTAG